MALGLGWVVLVGAKPSKRISDCFSQQRINTRNLEKTVRDLDRSSVSGLEGTSAFYTRPARLQLLGVYQGQVWGFMEETVPGRSTVHATACI